MLTLKIIKYILGLKDWKLTEKEKLSADLNYDGEVDISDVEVCVNYIVFGKLESGNNNIIASPTIEAQGSSNGVNGWYTSSVNVKIIENENLENISKTETNKEIWIAGKDAEDIKKEKTTDKQFILESIIYTAFNLYNNGGASKSKLVESHNRFEQEIEADKEEKLSRTQQLNTIKIQALKELGYTESDMKRLLKSSKQAVTKPAKEEKVLESRQAHKGTYEDEVVMWEVDRFGSGYYCHTSDGKTHKKDVNGNIIS